MTGFRPIFLTARREIRERARSRAFIVSTIVQMVIVVLIVIIGSATSDDTESYKLGTVGQGGWRCFQR